MSNDPRIKRVLKRYRKGDQFVDASVDVSDFEISGLLQACRCQDETALTLPKELDDESLALFAQYIGSDFDRRQFDYILHSYVRTEFVSSYYEDPSATSKPAPENGPHKKVPIPAGTQWVSVRPKDGQECYEAYEI